MALHNGNLDKKKVLVAMSGNIASAATAFLLKKQGYDVIGLFISYDQHVPFLKLSQTNQDQAKKYCEILSIPFYVTRTDEMFKDTVIDPFLDRKSLVLKADMRLAYHDHILKTLFTKMDALKCQFVSTGHYAKIQYDLSAKKNSIFQSNDTQNDQSFYLSSLSQSMIDKLFLPLGEIVKKDMEKIAQKFLIDKKVSQDKPTKDKESIKKLEDDYLKSNIPKFFTPSREIKSLDGAEFYGRYEGFPLISIAAPLEKYIPGTKKDLIILGRSQDGFIQAGESTELSFQFFEISNLRVSEGLSEEYILNVEAQILGNNKKITGLLILKSLKNARFESNEFIENVFPLDDIVFYLQEGSLRRLIGRGVIAKGIDNLSSRRLLQVGLVNELEKNPNFNFRF